MTKTPSPRKTRQCKRCKGKGRINSHVVHFGIHGGCFSCDTSGIQQFYTKEELSEKSFAGQEAHRKEILDRVEQFKQSLADDVIDQVDLDDELAVLRKAWKFSKVPVEVARGKWGR